MAENKMWSACLNSRSPRYTTWFAILGCDAVPLQSARSFLMELPPADGSVEPQSCEAYHLSITAMTGEQKGRLVEWIKNKYGGPTVSDIVHQLDTQGFPIRGEDVIVAFSMRGFM